MKVTESSFSVRYWTGSKNDSVKFSFFNRVDEADSFAANLKKSGKFSLVSVVDEKLGMAIGNYSKELSR